MGFPVNKAPRQVNRGAFSVETSLCVNRPYAGGVAYAVGEGMPPGVYSAGKTAVDPRSHGYETWVLGRPQGA